MSSTKKNEEKSSAPLIEDELQGMLALYEREAKRLETAHTHLQIQFYELKEKQEAAHQTLERIIIHMSDGLIFVSKDGVITHCNVAAAELIGYDYKRVMQNSYWDHFSDTFFGFSMQESLKKFTPHRRIFITLDTVKEIEVSASSIPEKGIVLLLCNRTEQQKLAMSLIQAERLKELGEMAASLAHEIRNPLGGIEGFAQILKRELQTPVHQKIINAILDGTHTLNHLVTQVLDYTRPLHLHFATIDLVTLIQESLVLASAFPNASTCNFKSVHSTYALTIDKEQIKLVLLNLLRNAMEAGASVIEIDLTHEGSIIIDDNGEGMSQRSLKNIFTPFFTTKRDGTGLGLARALAVIKAHGGTLEVASEEDKGTQFKIKL